MDLPENAELSKDLTALKELTDANGLDLMTEVRGAVVSQIEYIRSQVQNDGSRTYTFSAEERGWLIDGLISLVGAIDKLLPRIDGGSPAHEEIKADYESLIKKLGE